jgi:hypothetical protein
MKKISSMLLMLCLILGLSSCYTTTHVVGNGAQGSTEVTETNWYALYGLIELNEVDSKAMAGGATDYTIVTQHTFIDALISAFTNVVTISRQTTKVIK